MSESGTERPAEIQQAWDRITADPDREVFVVERNPGSGWRVSAVLTGYEDAAQYADDLMDAMNHCPEDFPEEFHHGDSVRIRYGGIRSATKMFEEYPPQSLQPGTDQ